MAHKALSVAFLSALTLGLLAGCRYSPEPTLTLEQSGQRVRLYAGDILTVKLESNPTTGYRWELVEPADEKVLKLLDQRYEQSPVEKGLVGAGGVETWRFRAVGRGSASLKLEYIRPWEKSVVPAKAFSLQVVVP